MADQFQNSLRRFPPEIREQIFLESLVRLTDEKERCAPSPSLLAAVRPDPILCEEALEIFYKINEFTLHHNSVSQFEGLKTHAIQRIRRLNNTDGLKIYRSSWELETPHGYAGWLIKLKSATELEELCLEIESGNPAYYFIKDRALQHFSKLKVMKLTLSRNTRFPYTTWPEQLEDKIGNRARKLDRYWGAGGGRVRESSP